MELSGDNLLIIRRDKLIYFGFWLIIALGSLTSHTLVAVPPTALFFSIGTILLIVLVPRIRFSNTLLLPILCILYFAVSQYLIGAPFGRYMGPTLSMSYFVVIVSFGFIMTENDRRSLLSKFILFSTIILFIECLWRLEHPQLDYKIYEGTDDVRWIYQYKFGGLMYVDSNAVGIHIVIIIFFIFYAESKGLGRWTKLKIILFILLALTFSRAAWIGTVLGWIYLRFLHNKSFRFYVFNSCLAAIFLLFFFKFYLQPKIETDLSFQSKIEIFHLVLKHFSNVSVKELLFGVGFSNSSNYLGIYAHNFFMVYLIESGLIGLTLILITFAQIIFSTNGKALLIIVPFLLTTLSSTITFTPFLSIALALIYLTEKQNSVIEK